MTAKRGHQHDKMSVYSIKNASLYVFKSMIITNTNRYARELSLQKLFLKKVSIITWCKGI